MAVGRLVGYVLALCVGFWFVSCAMVPKPVSENPATIVWNFAGSFYDTARDRLMTKSALTYWRKINEDGSFGDRFAIGGANAFNRAINTTRFRKVRDEVVVLDSGEYFLDSFELEAPRSIAQSQPGDYTERDGWDHGANAPRFLSLKVAPGARAALPKLVFKVVQNGDKTSYTQEIKILICSLENQKDKAKSAEDFANEMDLSGFALRFGNAIAIETAPSDLCEEIFAPEADRRK